MQEIKGDYISYLVFEGMAEQSGLRHGVSLRRPGPKAASKESIDFSPNHPDQARQCIDYFCRALELDADNLVRVRQVHGTHIETVTEPLSPPPEADAVCTNVKDLGLMLLGADCPLLILFDPEIPALGLAHAGWRGTTGRIAYKLVHHMRESFGSNPHNMLAGIGPGVCKHCYEVGMEVVREAQKHLRDFDLVLEPIEEADPRPGKQRWHFDMVKANEMQLVEAGLSLTNITRSNCCTLEQEHWFHSHRRDDARAGRWALLAGMR
ncbi:MAG: peptidoglycan editing factor PgeF [Sedimentisphaerales bacterium]|nr:peptidoglycan editing factor PgeF [Sedimentisphaerales bacterium]